ncbi:hypothetical protein LCGC14_0162620 [marine sediment metagenome]|uniref:DUF4159 domain-containing protein n=1 Tax=marine sediment metagenome TaxID=412755 RepID=A0A0F9XD95_9ZZZZ|nr:DUF4159 domain-containing protein [Phycisphaerae bacterium]
MRRMASASLIVLTLCLSLAVPANAQMAAGPEFGRKVDESIKLAQEFLLSLQNLQKKHSKSGSWEDPPFPNHADKNPGLTALITYALLESGINPQDLRMKAAIKYLGKTRTTKTYAVGLRANVWYSANRKTNDRYLRALKHDAGLLSKGLINGTFGYDPGAGNDWDHSNAQYGVLGMWAVTLNGLDIPTKYWRSVMNHWKRYQLAGGGWGYDSVATGEYYGRRMQPTMSVGGLATLYICVDNLPSPPSVINCTGGQLDPSIQRALAWLDKNFRQTMLAPDKGTMVWHYYYIYGVERAALASGYKYFGNEDWYRFGASMLIKRQIKSDVGVAIGNRQVNLKGSWNGYDHTTLDKQITRNYAGGKIQLGAIEADTAFALLFLLRGKQPVLFNKLQFNGDWDNRPRDLASLTRWISKKLESDVNWQIIRMDTPVSEWRDAPFIYISGNRALPLGPGAPPPIIPGAAPGAAPPPPAGVFDQETMEKLRTYVNQGGTILSVTEHNGPQFTTSIRQFYKTLFPKYELIECPPDHPIYTCNYKLKPGKPTFFIVSNGIRPLAIHTDSDLAVHWETRAYESQKWAFEAATNLVLYVIDSMENLPYRATNTWLSAPDIPGLGEGDGGRRPVAVGGGGGGGGAAAGPVDWIYILTADGKSYRPADGKFAGMQAADGTQIPRPTDPGRVTVVTPEGLRISIPESLLNTQLMKPDKSGTFLAQRSGGAASPSAPQAPAAAQAFAGGSATIVRLKHGGNYDPEPLAYQRFVHLMRERAATNVNVLGPIAITQLPNYTGKLAVLTGTETLNLSAQEMDAIKKHVVSGGTIFIDAGGGSETFDESVKSMLRKMFPDDDLKTLAGASPVYNIPNATIGRVRFRSVTRRFIKSSRPQLKALLFKDRPGVIYSREDVTGGLVGYPSRAVDGYDPVSAFRIMRNVVLFAGRN